MSSRQIAQGRGISVDAVKFHVANVVVKVGVGNRKGLRQWFQAPRYSGLAQRKNIVPTATKLGPIGQISRSVKDIEQSQSWYAKVLGLPHLYTFGKLAFFDCGGTRLLLTQQDEPASESILYLRVDDIERTCEELRSRSVEFINTPHMIHKHADGTEEWMAFFKDPEGRPLAIMSQVKA
jgi:catechol 2,3-dioxygenase-like lactoylglutathione lyase family enzyme